MLEKLAKKLRHLGLDCLVLKNSKREDILKLAVEQKRVILTKNKEMISANTSAIIYFIDSKKLNE